MDIGILDIIVYGPILLLILLLTHIIWMGLVGYKLNKIEKKLKKYNKQNKDKESNG